MFSDLYFSIHAAKAATWRRRLAATSASGYAGCCAALRDADLTDELGRICAPTLVVGGELDTSTPPEQALALASAIQDARLRMLPAAHLANLEQPVAFTAALCTHLEAC